MLGKMRLEMHEFSVPLFQKAVKEELKDIRARQKAILDQIIVLDAEGDSGKTDKETVKEPVKKDTQGAKKSSGDASDKAKNDGKKKRPESAQERMYRNVQSNVFVFAMSLIGGTLICIVAGIAIKVST